MDFKLGKPKNFKNISGSYAYITPSCSFSFVSNVLFDVNFNDTKPSIYVANNKIINETLDSLRNKLIDCIYDNRIYNVSKETLKEYYISPIKKVKKGKKLVESVKLKISDPEINVLCKKSKVELQVNVSSIWINEKSFGVYLNVTNVQIQEKKCLLVSVESDSDIELNI
jgi:hypothetical protein